MTPFPDLFDAAEQRRAKRQVEAAKRAARINFGTARGPAKRREVVRAVARQLETEIGPVERVGMTHGKECSADR